MAMNGHEGKPQKGKGGIYLLDAVAVQAMALLRAPCQARGYPVIEPEKRSRDCHVCIT